MAQLNDLIVLGNTSLIGETSIADKLNVPEIILKGSDGGDATIKYASTITDTTHTLPATTGTLLNTGTTTWTAMDPTAAKVGTLKLNGSNKTLYDVFLYSRGANLKSSSITDVNTVKAPSIYYSASRTESSSITNTPWTLSGYRLITMAGYAGISDYGYQLGAASTQMFWRTMGSNNGSPSDWYSWIKYKYGTAVGSNATPIYLNSSGEPLPISILSTGNGGTGNSSFTKGTLIYASSATKLSSNGSATTSGSTITLTNSSTGASAYTATNANGAVQLLASTNRGVYDSTNSKWIVYTSKTADHTYIPLWKNKGSSTQPVYFNSSGEPVAATAYSGLLTGLSWSNRTLSLTVGGTNKTAAIPTTLTGFSSITSTDFWGELNRKYNANTSNAIIGMNWYKSDGTTLYQYILGRNATSGTDDGETSHILINPSYDTSKTTYDTSQGLVIGKNTFTYYGSKVLTAANYASTTNGTYVNVTGDTMTGNLTMHDSDGTNPWIGFKTKDSTSYLGYIQLSGTTMYIGNGSSNSLSIDNTGKTSTPQSYYTSNTARGYYLKDSAGKAYPGVYDNGTNLWLGSTATASTHHKGSTYISAGHDGTSGNPTIYVSVPNAANNNGTNYGVFHAGYLDVSKATAGTLAIARGGTGATTAAAARTNLGVPPTSHASTATTYGVGDSTKYGHVILYPASSCTSYTSDSGGACTPAAVKKAVKMFGSEFYFNGTQKTNIKTYLKLGNIYNLGPYPDPNNYVNVYSTTNNNYWKYVGKNTTWLNGNSGCAFDGSNAYVLNHTNRTATVKSFSSYAGTVKPSRDGVFAADNDYIYVVKHLGYGTSYSGNFYGIIYKFDYNGNLIQSAQEDNVQGWRIDADDGWSGSDDGYQSCFWAINRYKYGYVFTKDYIVLYNHNSARSTSGEYMWWITIINKNTLKVAKRYRTSGGTTIFDAGSFRIGTEDVWQPIVDYSRNIVAFFGGANYWYFYDLAKVEETGFLTKNLSYNTSGVTSFKIGSEYYSINEVISLTNGNKTYYKFIFEDEDNDACWTWKTGDMINFSNAIANGAGIPTPNYVTYTVFNFPDNLMFYDPVKDNIYSQGYIYSLSNITTSLPAQQLPEITRSEEWTLVPAYAKVNDYIYFYNTADGTNKVYKSKHETLYTVDRCKEG